MNTYYCPYCDWKIDLIAAPDEKVFLSRHVLIKHGKDAYMKMTFTAPAAVTRIYGITTDIQQPQ